MNVKDRNVIITGGAGGLGGETVRTLAEKGANVFVLDVNEEAGKKLEQEVNSNNYDGKASFVLCDLLDLDATRSCAEELVRNNSSIDILINNAAVFTAAPITEIKREDYQQVFDINVSGTLFTLQAVAKKMIERGKGGKIINMASQAGRRGESLVAVYCATKAAVISLTQSAGLNLIKHKINVNAISPGVVDGEHWDGVDAFFAKYEGKPLGQKKKEVGEGVPYGRMGLPSDLVGMAMFLASEESNYVVAQTYNVDGGQWMS